ncbi:MAG: hypothetical protein K2X82_29255 [Gemmataceae bacterium]|nr:hypothetical protein [Gemmataceae bacterium]
MTTRWKLMAGVLGVSLAGLAGIAGPCPKPDPRADDLPKLPDPPKVPGGVTPDKPAPPPVDLPPPAPSSLPALPDLKVPPPSPPKADDKKPEVAKKPDPVSLPSAPAVALPVAAGQAPALPTDLPKPSASPVAAPATLDVPALGAAPVALPSAPPAGGAVVPETNRDLFAPPASAAPKPAAVTPLPDATKSLEIKGATVGLQPAGTGAVVPPEFAAPATTPVTPVAATVAVPSKFRIVLRVGEGEPVFEVRHGDDLVMKVVSEKVDVKSPEKGPGLSAVTATGKVRFVGFGSEGTCDSLSFLAGAGEVALSGGVKVQVKDKIGRVESELTADQMKYKIDTTTLPGSIKP